MATVKIVNGEFWDEYTSFKNELINTKLLDDLAVERKLTGYIVSEVCRDHLTQYIKCTYKKGHRVRFVIGAFKERV